MYMSTLTGRAHGANGRRATSGSSTDICPRIKRNQLLSWPCSPPLSAIRFLVLFVLLTFCIAMVMLQAGPKPE